MSSAGGGAAASSATAPSIAGQTVTCWALVQFEKDGPQRPMKIHVDPPKAGEVRFKNLANSLCATDLHEPGGSSRVPAGSTTASFPTVIGHEAAGIVTDVGEGVTSIAVGDHVIPLYTPECKNCTVCNYGRVGVNGCTATEETQGEGVMLDGTSRLSYTNDAGEKCELLHFMGCSGFAEYCVVNEINCSKISKDAPLERVCLLGCGVTTGHGAVLNTCQVRPDSTAAVFGAGTVGGAVISALKHVGCSRIVAIDTKPERLEMARRLGATDCLNPLTDVTGEGNTIQGKVWETLGNGADYVFECVGNVKVMESALDATNWGGGVLCIIGVSQGEEKFAFRSFQVVCGKIIKGSAFGGTKGRSQLAGMVESYMAGRPPLVDEFVSGTMDFREWARAWDDLKSGRALRTVLTFPHEGDAQVAAHRARWTRGAVIFLHGLGDCGASWEGCAEWLANSAAGKRSLKVVCPTAPVQPITKNNGERETAWFDVKQNWPWTNAHADDEAGLAHTMKFVNEQIDKLVAEGIPSERIIIMGFSQGAVTACQALASVGKKLGGVVMLSGWVPCRAAFTPHAANANTPVLMCHGSADEIVSVECQAAGAEALAAKGVAVTQKTYNGLGHDTSEEELEGDVLAFMKSVLGTA